MPILSRRAILEGGCASLAAVGLAGCVGGAPPRQPLAMAPMPPPPEPPVGGNLDAYYATLYGPVPGDRFPIPAVNLSSVNRAFLRTRVAYATREPPGTIIIEPSQHYLYHVLDGSRAIRYGVGVGREGFGWSGVAEIHDKQEWPDWYPPKEMIQRQPELRRSLTSLQGGTGMPGGPRNPLGARAMYLWQNNKDTLYRIHGTNEPSTIGRSVSSGCIRMINQDAIDLYGRTAIGTKVIVASAGAPSVVRLGRST